MGRKSLAVERKRQILDAFKRSIIINGLESASLDYVAKEAGVNRSIIRHYIGNRDQLFDALVDQILNEFCAHFEDLFRDALRNKIRERIFASLFTYDMGLTAQDVIIIHSLILAKNRHPSIEVKLTAIFEKILNLYAIELGRLFPSSTVTARRGVAYAIFSLAISHESMVWLGVNEEYMEEIPVIVYRMIDSLAAVRQ